MDVALLTAALLLIAALGAVVVRRQAPGVEREPEWLEFLRLELDDVRRIHAVDR